MAILRVRGDVIHIQYYNQLTGKTNSISTNCRNTKEGMKEAKTMLKYFEIEQLENPLVKKVKLNNTSFTLSEIFRNYIAEIKIRDSTKSVRKTAVEHLISAIGDKYVVEINSNDYKKFIKYLEKKNLSTNSIAIYSSELHSFFTYLVNHKHIAENIIKITPRKNKQIRVIPENDFQKILNHFYSSNKKHYAFLCYLALTGQRKSDALNICWEQIDWQNKIINFGNQKKDRQYYFPLTNNLIDLFKLIGIKEEGKIFEFNSIHIKFFERAQKGCYKKNKDGNVKRSKPSLELESYYTFHQFRKTFISKMLENGLPLQEVAALADHKDIETTRKYYTYVNMKKIGDKLNLTPMITLEKP